MPPASFIHPATVFPQRMTNTPGEKMESTATRPHTHTHMCETVPRYRDRG